MDIETLIRKSKHNSLYCSGLGGLFPQDALPQDEWYKVDEELHRLARLGAGHENCLTYGQGGANHSDSQLIDRIATLEQAICKYLDAVDAEENQATTRLELSRLVGWQPTPANDEI